MATVPSMTTFTAGQVLTAALVNSNVRDLGNYVLNPPMCMTNRSTTQAITTSTNTGVILLNEDFDSDGIHSTVSNQNRFTIVTGGYYEACGVASFAANATGFRVVFWRLNGAGNQYYQQSLPSNGGGSNGIYFSGGILPVLLVAGDYLEFCVWQNSGGNLNVDAATASIKYVSRGS